MSELLEAAKSGAFIAVHSMLKIGANVNEKDEKGNTALHYAAASGDKQILSILLGRKKIDLNSKNLTGQTPLDWAIANNRQEAISRLQKAGAVRGDQ